MSRPSGILTAPKAISDETANRIKTSWEANYGGDNIGRVAVLGDDLKFIPMAMTAEDAQLVDQLKLTAEIVCSTFHVPRYKVLGDTPAVSNVEALEQQYYSQCLQILIESIELSLEEGLEVPDGKGVDFDLDGLLRMDQATQINSLGAAVKNSITTPNEARQKLNKPPLIGGDTVYLQQQNYSIEALAKRDAQDDPFNSKEGPPAQDAPADTTDQTDKALRYLKSLRRENMIHA